MRHSLEKHPLKTKLICHVFHKFLCDTVSQTKHTNICLRVIACRVANQVNKAKKLQLLNEWSDFYATKGFFVRNIPNFDIICIS